MTLTTNPQLELAYQYVTETNTNIFLTGKAGTGKTTFLHRIKEESIKRTVVVAPTGVAAINAGGMTIHSFFQLPFGPYIPGTKQEQRKFAGRKIKLIRSLDLLIIDEISMVRADMLDAIDEVLRRYKNPTLPFGGVQLLMIGDLHQLAPVVKHDEWRLLSPHYSSVYFFGSRALQESDHVTIQLKHIFRQSDQDFIKLLNKVRDNKLDDDVLQKLNSRYIQNFQPTEAEPYITLTSHNNSAYAINQEKLDLLQEKSHFFTAEIKGDFPKHAYPTLEKLELKVGAQVLFIKNDLSPEKRFYNGKIGKITEIESETIHVLCPDDYEPIPVKVMDWTNVKYKLNETSKEVEENEVGKFTQYPLKLAWAITIHKSQGLTFERAIIDAQSAFAHGQVYVALSRCKTFEGIVLRSKIVFSSVKTDSVVKSYSDDAEKNEPNTSHLEASKKNYQQSLIQDLFDFNFVKKLVHRVYRIYLENENTLSQAALNQFKEWIKTSEATIFSISEKFKAPLLNYFSQTEFPETNEDLQNRIKKASVYFLEKLEKYAIPELEKIPVLTDNQTIKKQATENLKNLEKELFIKKICFANSQNGFVANDYLKIRANAGLDFEKTNQKSVRKSTSSAPRDTPHPELYLRIKNWRDQTAMDEDVVPYQVVSYGSITELTQFLPTNAENLIRIKGIGKSKIKKYGTELTEIIENYCSEKNISSNLMVPVAPKLFKADTKTISFNLFSKGKTIDEIAKERGFVRSTIERHLGHFVEIGKLNISELIPPEKIKTISDYFSKNREANSTEVIEALGQEYSYFE
ncbi:MAG TPA: helicase, partial [Phaeodactylibacter sp.]|nr:helicase [Phaeodactylibacter sp.]